MVGRGRKGRRRKRRDEGGAQPGNSPLFATLRSEATGVPPTLVLSPGVDTLRDEGEDYVEAGGSAQPGHRCLGAPGGARRPLSSSPTPPSRPGCFAPGRDGPWQAGAGEGRAPHGCRRAACHRG